MSDRDVLELYFYIYKRMFNIAFNCLSQIREPVEGGPDNHQHNSQSAGARVCGENTSGAGV